MESVKKNQIENIGKDLLEKIKGIKAVIFDLDGTLIDTLEDLADSFNYALNKFGYKSHDPEAYKYFIGSGAAECVMAALEAEQGEAYSETEARREAEAILPLFNDHYKENFINKTRPYPGIIEVLEQLEDRGILINVLSNKNEKMTRACVEHFFPHIGFQFILGHTDRFALKPDPESAQFIIHSCGLKAGEVAMLGDTRTDMETAVNAGMLAVGASWGFRKKEELIYFGADMIIEEPAQIPDYFIQN